MKTLKDLDVIDMHERKGMINQVVSIEELKAEAIKWYHRSDDNKHKFIREFFNITSEDLK